MTEQTLHFGKKPIRIVIMDGEVWWAAKDLYASQKALTDKRHLSCFDRQHLRLHTFNANATSERLTIVSTLGALTIATLFRTPGDRMVDGWVRKQVEQLGFVRPPLALCADGTLPVRPKASWMAYEAWDDLARAHPGLKRNPEAFDLPELDDDDDGKPPVPTPEQVEADRQAMLNNEAEVLADEPCGTRPATKRGRVAVTTRSPRTRKRSAKRA
ncbi:hypothetical protein [Sphingomonas sp. BK580]|uniref:hypothetical protein n=1 Tax=Sphingomonas sp. BK580 TaxID=2586972 RepID=UPI001607972F|nr:hypothetical protein [Sphingomonas sp. BK580]MBB3692450.1 hypothetical protein [Sphingomonas sp. BK580]